MKKYLIAVSLGAMAAAGCSQDKGAPAAPGGGADTGAASAAAEQAPPMAESVLRTGVIDHSRDVKEFELRRSLWGVEDLIAQYKQNGHDTRELEAQRAKLIADLKALLK
jgi:hypothetical protein